MLTIERQKKFPGSKALFLAPTRPLIEQHFKTFQKELPELFATLELFTGSVDPQKRKSLFNKADIIFSTPQCIANDISSELYSLEDISLLIIDEAHRCLKNYSYTAVVTKYKSQAKNIRILGLTASPGSDLSTIKEICQHLDIEKVESRSRDSPDVKPYLQSLEFERVEVPFPQEFIEIRTLLKIIHDSKIEQLKSRHLLFGPANKIALLALQNKLAAQASSKNFNAMIGMSLCAQAIKISHALELLETQTLQGTLSYLQNLIEQANQKKSKGVQTLVKTPEFSASVISLQHLLAQKIEHPKLEELKTIIEKEFKMNEKAKIIVFTQYRETASIIQNSLSSLPNIKSSVFLGQAKKTTKSGTSGLSQKEQKEIIQKFRDGEINVLIATSIGEEGLDIPEVSAVIFYEPIPSAIRKIQRAGRTARLEAGKLFILMTKDTRDIAFHYASTAKEKRMHKHLETIKDELEKQQ